MTAKAGKLPRRRWVPEVIQTSRMDCGPAALKSILEGCGVRVSYGRLREACHTSVDGTSIDTLEEIANALGVVASQTLEPTDHLFEPSAKALPAIVVVAQGSGEAHFLVVWSQAMGFVQVMDPGVGRQVMSVAALQRSLYLHAHPFPEEDWLEWATSPGFLGPVAARLRRLGVGKKAAAALEARAVAVGTARSVGAFDAAVRMTTFLVESRSVPRGGAALGMVTSLWERAHADETSKAIPSKYWTLTLREIEGVKSVIMRGAVVLKVESLRGEGVPAPEGEEPPPPLPPELRLALDEPEPHPMRALWKHLREDGLLSPTVLAATIGLLSAGILLEAALFRGLIEMAHRLVGGEQRAFGLLAVVVLLVALGLLALAVAQLTIRQGRHLEVRLRRAYFEKVPRVDDQYFQSRLASDMSERGHMLVLLRRLPDIASRTVRSVLDVVLTGAGLLFLDPTSLGLVVATVLFASVGPLLFQPVLAEREMRTRSHQGALMRFYLDALSGLVPLRVHAAEKSLQREHESVLAEWWRSGLRLQRASVMAEGVLSIGMTLLTALLVIHQFTATRLGASALLAVYWSLQLPMLASQAAEALRQYPALRNTLLRVLELLRAPEGRTLPAAGAVHAAPSEAAAVAIELENVTVLAAGHRVLSEVSLRIEAGEHVAVVGVSGAGKSSLVGLLLGWYRPAEGRILVDGDVLEDATLQQLRRETAWVDPAVQLWNDSFLANLEYGTEGGHHEGLAKVLHQADLHPVVERLPQGIRTTVGEGGALLSGGEGQRLRLGRALYRGAPRLAILDEAFRGLTRDQRHGLLARVRRSWNEATMLCVSHDIEETQGFPRVLVVHEGRIVEDGAPEVLAATEGSVYRRLLDADGPERNRAYAELGFRKWRLQDGVLVEGGAP